MPEYHNPDPLVRLIGEANEAPAIVEGIPITSLVDSGGLYVSNGQEVC